MVKGESNIFAHATARTRRVKLPEIVESRTRARLSQLRFDAVLAGEES